MAKQPKKTLDEQAFEAAAELLELENEVEIRKIVENERKDCKEYKRGSTHAEASYSIARYPFGLHVPYTNWLRGIDRLIREENEGKIEANVAIIERFPLPSTAEGKKWWLANLNHQFHMYFGNKVEIVFKDKK